MYAHIRGEVAELGTDRAVIEAAGVGYELFCSSKTLDTLRAGTTAKLLTHLHMAENVVALYGFADDAERAMFRRLLSVTRVGPKLALGVLSVLTPSDVAAAIVTDNAAAFARVPGMGKKTAQRVLLELKEKVDALETAGAGGAEDPDMRAQAVAALVGLGYDGASASRAVMAVEHAQSIEELITQSLRKLAKN